jgi:hypothetical protein
MSMAELFLKMFATRRADGIRPTRDETRLSVCARLRVKVSGFGKDPTRLVMDMPRIYNSRLSKRPLLRAQTIVCGEMYTKYMHMRCTDSAMDSSMRIWLIERGIGMRKSKFVLQQRPKFAFAGRGCHSAGLEVITAV